MLVKINKRMVDVFDRGCADRDCFALGFDKGTFSQGRGYTSYHTDGKGKRVEKAVCATRHYHGCPTVSVCDRCRTCSAEKPGGACKLRHRPDCGGTLVEPDAVPELS